jgi:hypothetical protein
MTIAEDGLPRGELLKRRNRSLSIGFQGGWLMSDYPGLRMSGLLTDLYELTMAAGYVQKNIEARAHV